MDAPLLAMIVLAAVILVLLAVVLGVLLRRSGGGGTGVSAEQLRLELQGQQRTLLDGVERARAGLEEAQRHAAQLQAAAQREAAAQLAAQVQTTREETRTAIADRFAALQQSLATTLGEARKAQDERLDKVEAALKAFGESAQQAAAAQREALLKTLGEIQQRLGDKLDALQKENSAQLDRIRGTVEEKLQTALETRLTESFKVVTAQLEQVARGLGEMQQLVSGVGDLKRVLTNVRSRGTFGETQLGALLEQVLTPQQYACNVATVPGSTQRVEFAIRLPGRDEDRGTVWLPIDAKFPQEDYLRLQQAYEEGNQAGVEEARAALRKRMAGEAETICRSYLSPPATTDFALLFLPTEGLYAEVLRIPGLAEEVQRTCRVVITGPTNLYALLNSLQMGFRTLAIQQRSSEVWKVLGAVKTEFEKFGETLGEVEKKLGEATRKLGNVGVRSRALSRKLREVETVPETEAALLLGATGEPAEPEAEP